VNIRILGAGFYGCHIASALLDDGHQVAIFESRSGIFEGASGNIPARLHQGFHYPRSKATRDACQQHEAEFMAVYGEFTRRVPYNLYAIAADRSLVDFAQYEDSLHGEVEFEVVDPAEYGLQHVEGALLTTERHIVISEVRQYFLAKLAPYIRYNTVPYEVDDPLYDLTIDATFCAYDEQSIDRYEPCIVGLLKGPIDVAVTIMDGPFGSLYPWDEDLGLSSLSSAKWTPITKNCHTHAEAQAILGRVSHDTAAAQFAGMYADLRHYYPALDSYDYAGCMFSVRAMPLSGADSRLVDIVLVGKQAIRIRAGKLDAVVSTAREIKRMIDDG